MIGPASAVIESSSRAEKHRSLPQNRYARAVVDDDGRVDRVVVAGVERDVVGDQRRAERVAERAGRVVGDGHPDRAAVDRRVVDRDVPEEPAVALDDRAGLRAVAGPGELGRRAAAGRAAASEQVGRREAQPVAHHVLARRPAGASSWPV